MRHRIAIAFLGFGLILAGCADAGDDPNGEGNPTIEPPPPQTGAVAPHITSSAQYKWSIPDQAPARNPNCEPGETGIYGAYVEWKGFVHDGTTYTCNACPGGRELWQGTWRAVAADADPTVPFDDPSYAERIIINGNTWTMDISNDAEGSHRFEGFYWCGQKPEVNNETNMFVFTKVSQEGAFGWSTGGAFSVVVLESGSNIDGILMGWKDGVDTNFSGLGDFSAPFCRVGTTVYNEDGEPNPCTDPFL